MPRNRMLGEHPRYDKFGCHTTADDTLTDSEIPHRSLMQDDEERSSTIGQIRKALIKHHVSAAMIHQDQRKIKNLKALGYPVNEDVVHRFPLSDTTRKGNVAEVFLAEYICASSYAELPVYRLRYNPNVEQSMKGDDVLAFDFTTERPRIIVGEAKFRGTPSKKAVHDIVSGLVRSHQAGLPASLQFVADRLYELDNIDLANRVSDCALEMANGRLELTYIGLLLSNATSRAKINRHTDGALRNLVMISLGMDNPSQVAHDCFEGIETEAYDNPD